MTQAAKVASLCIIFALASLATATSQSKVRIRGRVIFEPSQRPLAEVTVKLLRPDNSLATRITHAGKEGVPQLLGITKTDSAGNFCFETNSPGPYEIVCFRPGHHAGTGMRSVDPKAFFIIQYPADVVPFTLRPGEEPPRKEK